MRRVPITPPAMLVTGIAGQTDDMECVLVWAPRNRDAQLAVQLLVRNGFSARAWR